MGVALFVLLQLASGAGPASCRDVDLNAILAAQQQLARGDDGAARAALESGTGDICIARRVASLALRGWSEARALAPAGGAPELQGAVRRTLEELHAIGEDGTLALEIEYAETCIRAAIAAAQDERPEMELLLTHARDLTERLALRDRRAVWPRTFNLLAGELWFEVDRYEDAAAAYDRAVRADETPVALVGLARAQMRLDRVEQACATYRRVKDAAPPLTALMKQDLSRCR